MRKPIKGLTLVKVKALVAFTKTTRHGQFHGNPATANGVTHVPDYVVDELVKSKRIQLATDAAPAAKRPSTPATSKAPSNGYTMTHKGGGNYLISGPGVPVGTKIKGKQDAQTYIDGVKAAVNAPEGPAGDSDAPVD